LINTIYDAAVILALREPTLYNIADFFAKPNSFFLLGYILGKEKITEGEQTNYECKDFLHKMLHMANPVLDDIGICKSQPEYGEGYI